MPLAYNNFLDSSKARSYTLLAYPGMLISAAAASSNVVPLNLYAFITPPLLPINTLSQASATIPPCIKTVFPVNVTGAPTGAPVILLNAFKFNPFQ